MAVRQDLACREPLTDIDEYTSTVLTRELPPSITTREFKPSLAPVDSSELDQSDSDYGSAWDFNKMGILKPAEEECPELPPDGDTGEPIFIFLPHFDTSIPLRRQKWYHGPITRMRAESLLNCPYSFLVRLSESDSSCYVLSVKNDDLTYTHLKIRKNERGYFMSTSDSLIAPEFLSVPECIGYYQQREIATTNNDTCRLLHPILRK